MSAPLAAGGRRDWIAVASAEHVRLGRAAGFLQIGHGKMAPLRRIRGGDRVVFYSPTVTFGGRDALKSFTALGVVRDGEPYRVAMEGGFRPFRRDVDWLAANETPIRPLLDKLDFACARPNWGYQLRFGLVMIGASDMNVIAAAMAAGVDEGPPAAVNAAAAGSIG